MNLQESTAQRLQAEFATLCGHLNVLHARMVELTAEALVTGAWAGVGLKSPEHWLCWQTGLSPARAKRIVEMAWRRDDLPITFAAFANGELAVDQVAVVAKHARSHTDEKVCEMAKNGTVRQLSSALARLRYVEEQAKGQATADASQAPPDGDATEGAPHDAAAHAGGGDAAAAPDRKLDPWQEAILKREQEAREAREAAQVAAAVAPGRMSHGYNDDGRFYLHLELPADEGAAVDQALKEAHSRLFHGGRKDVSWADAMVDVAHRSLGAIESPDRRDQYRTYIHLATDGTWLNDGPAVPRTLFEKLTCDGVVRPLWETEGIAVNVGRKQHAIPPHTRRVVLDRDGTCRYPGCPNTRHLEVHHVLHWADDHGPTDTWNLAAHCAFHHDAIHRGFCTVEGDADAPDGLVHRFANGRVIVGHNKASPPGTAAPPGPPPGHHYRHPLGEPITNDLVWFASPTDDDGEDDDLAAGPRGGDERSADEHATHDRATAAA